MGLNPHLKSDKKLVLDYLGWLSPSSIPERPREKKKQRNKTKLSYYMHDLTLSSEFSCMKSEKKKKNSHFKC